MTDRLTDLLAHLFAFDVTADLLHRDFVQQALLAAALLALLDKAGVGYTVNPALVRGKGSGLAPQAGFGEAPQAGFDSGSATDIDPALAEKLGFQPSPKSSPKPVFTVGINDDVTGLSLDYDPDFEVIPPGMKQAVFFGLGSDGTQKPDGEDSATPRRHDSTVPVQLLRHLPLAGIRPGGVVLGRSHRPGALLPGHWSVVHRSGALIWAVARQAKQPGSMFRPLRRNASPCFHRRDPDDGNLATPEYLHQSAGVLERRSDGRSTNGGGFGMVVRRTRRVDHHGGFRPRAMIVLAIDDQSSNRGWRMTAYHT